MSPPIGVLSGAGPDPTSHPVTARLGDDGLLLHIGVPKTGTTALQSCLAACRPSLARAAVAYPGTAHNHVPAVRFALGWPATPEQLPRDQKRWRSLVRDVHRHHGRVIVSAESLAVADASRAGAIIDELARSHVEVVVTLRPLAKVLPSAWQEDVKAGLRTPFHQWLEEICRGPAADSEAPVPFWVVQDHGAVVERWSQVVGPEHLTVVVVDSADPNSVFRRFEQLIGLAADTLQPDLGDRRNRSMTAAESEVLVRLNERLDGPGAFVARQRTIPPRAIWHLLDNRTPGPDEARLRVTPSAIEQIRPISEDAVRRIRAVGANVIGDLEHLVTQQPTHRLAAGTDPDIAPDGLPIEAAALLIEGLLLLDANRDSNPLHPQTRQ
jgi:hypothetical protein